MKKQQMPEMTKRLTRLDALCKDHEGLVGNHSNLVSAQPFAQIVVLLSSQLSVAPFHLAIASQMT